VPEFHWHVRPTRTSGTAFPAFAPRHGRWPLAPPTRSRPLPVSQVNSKEDAEHALMSEAIGNAYK
jgi:hypothetical protein